MAEIKWTDADFLVRGADLAAREGRTVRRLRQLASEGHIPKAVDTGYYPIIETVKALERYDIKTKKKPWAEKREAEVADEDEGLDLDQERARSTREDVIRKQRENARDDGLLIDREEMRAALSKVFQAFDTFLETLPDQIERGAWLEPEQAAELQKIADLQRGTLYRNLKDLD